MIQLSIFFQHPDDMWVHLGFQFKAGNFDPVCKPYIFYQVEGPLVWVAFSEIPDQWYLIFGYRSEQDAYQSICSRPDLKHQLFFYGKRPSDGAFHFVKAQLRAINYHKKPMPNRLGQTLINLQKQA
jgi:hypothetical protein